MMEIKDNFSIEIYYNIYTRVRRCVHDAMWNILLEKLTTEYQIDASVYQKVVGELGVMRSIDRITPELGTATYARMTRVVFSKTYAVTENLQSSSYRIT